MPSFDPDQFAYLAPAEPPGESRRLTDRIGRAVAWSVHQLRAGDDVLWDVALTQTGFGAYVPTVVLWMPVVRGQTLMASAQIQGGDIKRVDEAVANVLEQLRKSRDVMLVSREPAGQPVTRN